MEVIDKVCIITGSAQGIGKAYAVKLLENGAKICLADLNENTGNATLKEFQDKFGTDRVCFKKCDVTDEDDFNKVFDFAENFFNVRCIDLLVNNAGISENYGWKKCMIVNIMGTMTGTYIALDRMKVTKGTVINTASIAGLGPGYGLSAYSVSKHAVVCLTRSLATNFRDHGITFKAICPTWVDTEMVSSWAEPNIPDDVLNVMKKMLGGLMTPEYVAEGFYQLVTSCKNGAVMVVRKDFPYFIIPDTGFGFVVILGLISKLISSVNGAPTIGLNHYLIFLIIMALFLIFTAWIL